MNRMKQAHFFAIPTQGNVYTVKRLELADKSNKLLIATLKRQIYFFEYTENSSGELIPLSKEVSFTYIPSGTEIISLDVFNKSEKGNDFVIGIAIIKTIVDTGVHETYLNIYSESESKVFNIENIAQNCLTLELNFTPYHLTHTYLVTWQDGSLIKKEMVFLLSGSDKRIHVYKENIMNHFYKEIEADDLFPEFNNLPSVALWMDVHYYKNCSERISAYGTECGYLKLMKLCMKTNSVLFNYSTSFISPITQLRIYPFNKTWTKPTFITSHKDEDELVDIINLNINEGMCDIHDEELTDDSSSQTNTVIEKNSAETPDADDNINYIRKNDNLSMSIENIADMESPISEDVCPDSKGYTFKERVEKFDDIPNLNLVVVNATLPSVCFCDIVHNGLTAYTTLKRTDHSSVTSCLEIGDVDFDGVDEILIGSSAEEIKLYKLVNGTTVLKEIKKIVSPIFNIQYFDIIGDGVKELIVLTMKGLYVLQHNEIDVQRKLEEKVFKLTMPETNFT